MTTSLETLRLALEAAYERAELPPQTELKLRAMFGGLGASVNGRAFASLSNIGLALKLPPEAARELLTHDGAAWLQYEPNAPVSKTYVVLPTTMLQDAATLTAWLHRSADFALSLPAPKKRKS